jgi:hypothetical protein
MQTRTVLFSTMLASLLALAGCAQGTTLPGARAANAPYPMLGFASPGADPNETGPTTRLEDDRMLPRPLVMTDKWAR